MRASSPRRRLAHVAWVTTWLALASGPGCADESGRASTGLAPLDRPEVLTPADGHLGYASEINSRAVGLDLDGDGRDELVVAGALELAALRFGPEPGDVSVVWRAPSQGGATAVARGDIDGDGRDDLLVGWGMHRDFREAPARLVAYRTRGAPRGGLLPETIAAPATSRAQFASLQVTSLDAGGSVGVLYAHYASKYEVRAAFAEWSAGGVADREIATIRMGAEWQAVRAGADDTRPVLVVGRPYGDAPKSDGDVFALGDANARTRVPSFRGVRSLLDVGGRFAGPEAPAVCFGDGWHWRYRAEGRGQVTCARRANDGSWSSRRIAQVPDYSIETLAVADIDGDGLDELLAQGVEGLYAFAPDPATPGAWAGRRIGPGGYGFAALDVDGDGRQEVALAGERPALLRPGALTPRPSE